MFGRTKIPTKHTITVITIAWAIIFWPFRITSPNELGRILGTAVSAAAAELDAAEVRQARYFVNLHRASDTVKRSATGLQLRFSRHAETLRPTCWHGFPALLTKSDAPLEYI
jgi:hypothetical protein